MYQYFILPTSATNASHSISASDGCNSWINCTTTVATADRGHCMPDSIARDSIRIPVLVNIFFIIVVGGVGNTLTILATTYCHFKHRATFPSLWNMTTLLILHLALWVIIIIF